MYQYVLAVSQQVSQGGVGFLNWTVMNVNALASQPDHDSSFFERERDRLSREITSVTQFNAAVA